MGKNTVINEFKDFIAKGNVMDMAVGIIIGAAFTAIVTSLVGDIINPIIALFTGGIDFSGWFYALDGNDYASLTAAEEAGAPVFAIGKFVMAVINFLIIAFVVFMLVKMVNRVKAAAEKPDEVAPEVSTGPSELDVLLEIRGVAVPKTEEFSEFGAALEASPTLPYTVLRDGAEIEIEGPWLYPPFAASITPGSAAEKGGVEEGDVVTAIDGVPVYDFGQLRDAVGASDGNAVTLSVWRDGETRDVTLQPERRDLPLPNGGFETRYLIGIGGGLVFEPKSEAPGLGEALLYGVNQTIFIVESSVSGLYHMIAGKISTCNLSGPIGIAETSGQAASQGWVSFLWFIAVLSTAVGFLNLFPIPVLDGGHLVFHAFEWATGRPPSDKALRYLMAGGLTIMLALMLFAVGNDLFCP